MWARREQQCPEPARRWMLLYPLRAARPGAWSTEDGGERLAMRTRKTHTCGELRAEHVGETVTLMGWVHRRRTHGGVIFLDLRDRWGLTQVVVNEEHAPEAHAAASEARHEYVIAATGRVSQRPPE